MRVLFVRMHDNYALLIGRHNGKFKVRITTYKNAYKFISKRGCIQKVFDHDAKYTCYILGAKGGIDANTREAYY